MTTLPTHAPNILLVDDTPANLQLLVGMLQGLGYKVRPVTSGRHALKLVQTSPPDLILLDVTMPEMDGYEVCRQLKANPASKDIPVLFISALNDVQDKLKAFEVAGLDYVSKPFQIAEVASRVGTHLRLRQQQRELEGSLARERELEQMRDSLVHLIVHDMKSPLMACQMLLEMVKEDLGPGQADHVDLMRGAISSLVELVSQVLDVSRLESNALPLKPEPIDLPSLVEEQVRSIKVIARGITLHTDGLKPLLVMADRELVARVLFNLIGNALKFAASNGNVWVIYSQEQSFAKVEVVDDGIGIDPAYHARIFEKFGQVGNETKRRGTGLGLTFVKMAVEAQGGQVGVISQLGQGSRFWFTLPLTSDLLAAPVIAP